MPELTIKDSKKSLVITADNPLYADDPLFREILNALQLMHNRVPMNKFTTKLESENLYKYEFKMVDGRVWRQMLRFDGNETFMTFDIDSEWMLSEFILHRPIRDLIIVLIKKYKITDFKCTV